MSNHLLFQLLLHLKERLKGSTLSYMIKIIILDINRQIKAVYNMHEKSFVLSVSAKSKLFIKKINQRISRDRITVKQSPPLFNGLQPFFNGCVIAYEVFFSETLLFCLAKLPFYNIQK